MLPTKDSEQITINMSPGFLARYRKLAATTSISDTELFCTSIGVYEYIISQYQNGYEFYQKKNVFERIDFVHGPDVNRSLPSKLNSNDFEDMRAIIPWYRSAQFCSSIIVMILTAISIKLTFFFVNK